MTYPAAAKVRMVEMGKSAKKIRTLGLIVLLDCAIDPFLVGE